MRVLIDVIAEAAIWEPYALKDRLFGKGSQSQSAPLIVSTFISGKYFSPSFGGRAIYF